MAYLMVHLTMGYKLLDQCHGIKDKGAFLLGTVSPDAIMFRPGCRRSDKSLTHFCVGDEGWGFYTNYEDLQNSLFVNIEKFTGMVDKDFLFGYMAHVMTDIEHNRRFWTPTRLTGDDDYINAYFRDGYEIDSILQDAIEDMDALWSMLEGANRHSLDGLFTTQDNSFMLNTMRTEMYHNRSVNAEYIPSILTMPMVSQFMDEVVNKVIQYR